MPRLDNHPLVLARLSAGRSVIDLAAEIGVGRSAIVAIEDGRTQNPSVKTMLSIDRALNLRPGTLHQRMKEFIAEEFSRPPSVSLRARAVLNQTPAAVQHDYESFAAWRLQISPNRSSFATLLLTNKDKIQLYEDGIRTKGMPDALATALLQRLGISHQYLLALKSLPPS
jgi:transcriptional regulator with XRE-family HTH domain